MPRRKPPAAKHPHHIAEAADETRRTLDRLRDLIEDSDVPRRDIEARLGFSRGYLAQLLGGRVELKLWQLAAFPEALGVSPANFFHELFPLPPEPRGSRAAGLEVNDDIVRVYVYAIEAVRELTARLERCEAALEAVSRRLARRPSGALSADRRVDPDGNTPD